MKTWSLRTRLTAATTVAVAVILAVAATALVLALHHALLQSVDEAAVQRSKEIASDVEKGLIGNPVPTGSSAEAVVQVVDAQGRVVFASANVVHVPRLFTTPAGPPRDVTGVPVAGADPGDLYRVAAASAGSTLVYVALPADDVAETTRRLEIALLIGTPVLLAALASLASALIARVLRPVESAAARQRAFVADAAHELRSPLTALTTQLEVMEDAPDLLPDVRRMSALVDRLLVLARLDGAVPKRPVDLDDLVLTASNDPRIDVSGVSGAQVLGDPTALESLVENLLSNALRHAASKVTVTLRVADHHAALTVADDGEGIAAEDRQRVFERFTRLDASRERGTGGYGLGLAIVHAVVRSHGGTVVVEDAMPGARFVVRLPATAAARPRT